MTASVPVVAPAFAPDERPEPDGPAEPKEGRTRTGRHEPVRSSMPRIAAGVTGGHYLRHDLEAGLVAGAQLGSVAAGMAFAGAWAERRRMTRIAGTLSDLAVELATAGVPDIEAAPRLLEVRGADRSDPVVVEHADHRPGPVGVQSGGARSSRVRVTLVGRGLPRRRRRGHRVSLG